MTFLKTKQNKGFVILFAVTLASILIAIALGISNIALNEVNFSASVKDSDNAFYAADTGAECALYNDKSTNSIFVSSGWPSSITCGTSSLPLTELGSLPALSWSFNIPNMEGSSQCAQVSLSRDFSNPSFPSTQLDSQGYNIGNSSCASTNNNRTQREIQLSYSVATIPTTDGACAATHYSCSAGTSSSNVDGPSAWTWSCVGYSGGSTASCSENKIAGYSATGANQSTDGSYTVDTFPGAGTFTVSGGSGNVDYLIVAGGGSGGTSGNGASAGGGAGGVLSGSTTLAPNTYNITVGGGGAAVSVVGNQGNNGVNSTFNGLTAIGGGGGGAGGNAAPSNGLSGGSGGGAGYHGYFFATVGPGTAGQGNSGGQNGSNGGGTGGGAGGGGGGGAGGAGAVPTNSPLHNGGLGGAGVVSSISGSAVTYGVGGKGGGGAETNGTSGPAGTGDGGGGTYGGQSPTTSGAGGSGVVIIRYLTP